MKKKRLEKALNNSFINYFSDLFVAVMVIAWIAVIIIMIVMAIYATVRLSDVYIWSDVANLVAVPLTAGGAIYLVKCSVQHAIANRQGKECKMDFPRVPDTEDMELEQPMFKEDGAEGAESEEAG